MTPDLPKPTPAPLTQIPSAQTKATFPTDKIIGYIFLLAGILLILSALFSAFNLLTGKSKPPKVFNVQAPTINLPTGNINVKLPESSSLSQGESGLAPQGFKIIPDEVLNGSLNIGLSYLLFMFIASTGAKLASIGTQLIKDIKVVVKENKLKT